jgi:hypothetical protein
MIEFPEKRPLRSSSVHEGNAESLLPCAKNFSVGFLFMVTKIDRRVEKQLSAPAENRRPIRKIRHTFATNYSETIAIRPYIRPAPPVSTGQLTRFRITRGLARH